MTTARVVAAARVVGQGPLGLQRRVQPVPQVLRLAVPEERAAPLEPVVLPARQAQQGQPARRVQLVQPVTSTVERSTQGPTPRTLHNGRSSYREIAMIRVAVIPIAVID